MVNEDVRKTFRLRSAVTNFIRRYLQAADALAGFVVQGHSESFAFARKGASWKWKLP